MSDRRTLPENLLEKKGTCRQIWGFCTEASIDVGFASHSPENHAGREGCPLNLGVLRVLIPSGRLSALTEEGSLQ